jgi:predicted transposase YbfD/YdcC
VLCGSICGAESWRDFVLFGKSKLEYLRQYYEFKNGIPSKNTFARLFYALDVEQFKIQFVSWVKSLQTLAADVIAVDGKTLCNSINETEGKSAIHMVSAFATKARLILAQQAVDDKSNEITAIPKLLSLLDLKGHIVTIDAMGTQRAIAKQIIEQGGNYILALKGNQGTLNEDVRLFIETELEKQTSKIIEDSHKDVDKGHGRIETRACFVTSQIDWLQQKDSWAGLKTIAMIEETQEMRGKKSVERRFFISSLPPKAIQIASSVRAHWCVENQLHWTLDVVFNEDQTCVRKDNAGENMAVVRHITINMLNSAKSLFKDVGLKGLRKKAGWDNETLGLIFSQSF